MTNEEADELRIECADLRNQISMLLGFAHDLFTRGGTDKPKPTMPSLGLVADLFEVRCSDRDCLVQRLKEALDMVTR